MYYTCEHKMLQIILMSQSLSIGWVVLSRTLPKSITVSPLQFIYRTIYFTLKLTKCFYAVGIHTLFQTTAFLHSSSWREGFELIQILPPSSSSSSSSQCSHRRLRGQTHEYWRNWQPYKKRNERIYAKGVI